MEVTIRTKNIIGMRLADVRLSIKKIDDFVYYTDSKMWDAHSDKNGSSILNLDPGAYLICASKGKASCEHLIEIDRGNKDFTVKVPCLSIFINRVIKVRDEVVEDIFEKNRTDHEKCFMCHRNYKSYTDKFRCAYCNRYICNKHRLPENHSCRGSLINPHKRSLRERHTNAGIVAGE